MKYNAVKRSTFTGCASSLLLLSAIVASHGASAHGYLEVPPSRALMCQKGENKDCGGAQYEPQSVGETYKGFPAGQGGAPGQGPIDGKIASGGNERFSALDVQTATRWQMTEIKDRNIAFKWQYTAVHPATKHEYFITREGWNPNEALSRASFESTPFCEIDGGGEKPEPGTPHNCVIPDNKTGQHVILAIWTVEDTSMAFHNVTDVNILAEASLPGGWSAVGSIAPSAPLLTGDKVKARAFTASGESSAYSVEISIDNVEEGKPGNWSFKLAEAINKAHADIRAGVRDDEGNITPVKGTNSLYAQKETGVSRYEVQLDMKEDTGARLEIASLQPEYELVKGNTSLEFSVQSTRKMNLEAALFDEKNKQVGALTQTVGDGNSPLKLDARSAPGAHTLTLTGTTVDGRTTRQDTASVILTGEAAGTEYDFVFPDGIKGYLEGTKVLQEKTGEVFQCKPFPYSGWCTTFSGTANGYEPGIGSNWQDAWDKL
ncbi:MULTISPECIES: N-acetylglucosamine-binding protein GbpA [unclassified Pseudomonas]|uniref:N-acetylglucosamine-binding protein GbpA n=1 Tax=unclassified Pseudomonas TaxID=196821 RepID=UPI0011A289F9|nr:MULTISPECIES: N-acetylglucosamine-binding protein GbpA [unclassified Pseudomonas]TWC10542.1 chitin-binding protein [Pseudomonas sp. SJZ075]TWC26697.1 chitin-binding protein [Pseudomonas sp. SJZ078]TWC45846.1 chitin-binding protein [Pseudomonas sp. SJZ124]TWC81139.1 chitin-binding protein [Pseudomonas sp. SJZ101]